MGKSVYDVFISYSSKTQDVANELCRFLEANNIRCWIAPRNIQGGLDHAGVVPEAISNARFFVLVYSEYVPQSVWVTKEIHFAVNARKIIIPLRIDNSPLDQETTFLLCNCQWINAKDYSNFNEAFKHVCMAILPQMDYQKKEEDETENSAVEATDVPSYEDVKNDLTKLPLIKKLAQENNAEAQYVLACCYYFGTGEPQNAVEAVKWFYRAAEQEHAAAQCHIGVCYYTGFGVREDKVEAVKWYRKAAGKEHCGGQYALADCYFKGNGVAEDKSEAVKWYRKAAEKGLDDAQFALGSCYYNGTGVAEDKAEAVKWFLKAAEQGFVYATNDLGNCYYHGTGVEKDYAEAVKWYRKAAEQGFAAAQCNLGYCYENGIGVAEDKAEAVKWYRKAAEQGHTTAQKNLESLTKGTV